MRICGQPRHHDSKKQVLIVSSENYGAIATRLGRIPQSGLVQSAFCGELQNAEFERDILRDRVKAGIAQARKEGRPHGRPPTVRKHAGEIETLFADGVSKRQIAARLSISRASVRRMLALRRSVLR